MCLKKFAALKKLGPNSPAPILLITQAASRQIREGTAGFRKEEEKARSRLWTR
jgi:hypothetical protein